ncbi:MAG TPA: ParB N-terminal domain-containing protein [Terriglobia bacterium]|nr:ParB N-terminal domain-containing protein [Terriglobia bacterium]
MAVEFKTEHTRTSEYLFLPEVIKINPELNGRHELPDIEWLITSMVSSGQLQPVLIGNDGGKPVLYAGHSRWRAAIEINKRNLTAVPFKLRCVYFRGNEQQAFMATVRENRDRNATTAIDDAFNIAKLERYGMSLEEIAEKVYHEDLKWVKERLALIELRAEGQQKLLNNELKPNAAVALAKLSKEAQKKALESGQKLTVAAIKRFDADKVTQNGSSNGAKRSAARKWDKITCAAMVEEFLERGVPEHLEGHPAEDILRDVLGEILDKLNGDPE